MFELFPVFKLALALAAHSGARSVTRDELFTRHIGIALFQLFGGTADRHVDGVILSGRGEKFETARFTAFSSCLPRHESGAGSDRFDRAR